MSEKIRIFRASELLATGYPRSKLIQGFVDVNKAAWPPPVPQRYVWDEEKMELQLKNPDLLYCALKGEKIIGTVTFVYKTEDSIMSCQNWDEISSNGTLAGHDESGEYAFGVDLSVSPDSQGNNVSERLISTSFLISGILAGKKGVFLGSRIPSYHKYADKMSIEDYVLGKNRDGKTRDPEIRLYQSNGFRIVKIIPGYMEDPDSLDYGVLMLWESSFYRYAHRMKMLTKLAQFVTAKVMLR